MIFAGYRLADLLKWIMGSWLAVLPSDTLRSRATRKRTADTIGNCVPVTHEHVAGVGTLHPDPKH